MSRILLIEDEPNVRHPLKDYLTREGFVVLEAATLQEAASQLQKGPDLILLDWMLPDGQGIELLKKWRREGVSVPTIFLTARAELVDKVLGLELGANDYVTKPFEPRELVARIRVQLRGHEAAGGGSGAPVNGSARLESTYISLDARTHEARFQGQALELAKTEFALLQVFLENPDQVFSRQELLKRVWGYDQYPTTRTVDTHVLQLRQKTRADLFETVHGIGYRFRPEGKLANA